MDNGLINLVQGLNSAKVSNDFQTLVAKKAQDVQKQEGNSALQLLQSAKVPQPGSPGSNINIRV